MPTAWRSRSITMADEKERDAPVKVVDRRRWREDGESNPEAAPQT